MRKYNFQNGAEGTLAKLKRNRYNPKNIKINYTKNEVCDCSEREV